MSDSKDLLLPHHRKELEEGSGISASVIKLRGYRSARNAKDLETFGFSTNQKKRFPALVIPIFAPDGGIALYQMKPDFPVIDRKGKPLKYEFPAGSKLRLDVPIPSMPFLGDLDVPLYITEGVKKGDAGVTQGLCVVAVPSVTGWKGQNEGGGITALADWEYIAFTGGPGGKTRRDVFIVFDSDVMLKREVYRQLVKLRRFLEDKGAHVYVIYLPSGPLNKKVGLDDFFVGGGKIWQFTQLATSELRTLPEWDQPEDEEEDAGTGNLRSHYRETPEGTWWRKRSHEGRIDIPILTFCARIDAIIVRDDGESRTELYQVRAWANGHKGCEVMTPEEFERMAWPKRLLQIDAGVIPQYCSAVQAEFAIRQLSAPVERTTMYAHLGWRVIDDKWVYLHAEGGIGANGAVEGVSVDDKILTRYRLPDPPPLDSDQRRAELREAVSRSLDFLDVAARAQTWPLLAAVYCAPFATTLPCDFTVWMQGVSGSMKSTASALALSHFGDFDRFHLPGNFISTANYVELLTFVAKDALFIIDDYAPAPDNRAQAQQDAVAHRVLRGVGDQRGRGRMTKEIGAHVEKSPRSLSLVTSELPPPGAQSTEARTIVFDWERDQVDKERLKAACANHPAQYRLAMAAYLRWLAPQMPHLYGEQGNGHLRRLALSFRDDMPGSHGRVKETAAKLYTGVGMLLRFAVEVGAISRDRMQELLKEARDVLAACAERTGRGQEEKKPSAIFLDSLRACFAGGEAYLAEKVAGGVPPDHGRYGYLNSMGGSPVPPAKATKLGWVDHENAQIYLMPDLTYRVVKEFSESVGTPFPGTKGSLGKALAREGLLARVSSGNLYYPYAEGRQQSTGYWAIAFNTLWPEGEKNEEIPPEKSADPDGGGGTA
jgi:hypothetical protein